MQQVRGDQSDPCPQRIGNRPLPNLRAAGLRSITARER